LTREAKTRAGFRDGKLAAQIGISLLTLADVRSDSRKPMAKTMVKLRAFLDAEAKRNAAAGNQTDRASADKNHNATVRAALCTALSVLPIAERNVELAKRQKCK
jgi:hypothetical protein